MVAGAALGVAWVRRQRRLAEPMIDLQLFRIREFNAALAVNFLAILVSVGYFLFVAQYLQLVVGLSPFEAGLWSLPAAAGFIVGSQVGPRVIRFVKPAYLVSGGLVAAAAGLLVLTQVTVSGGLTEILIGSVVISLGLGPVFGLTTEMIVGSAPPEKAGAASGISETAAELGAALGIAVLGSVGVAIYRSQLSSEALTGVPAAAADAARDTLGGAVAAASQLPADAAATLVEHARQAFVTGLQITSLISAGIALVIAAITVVALRNVSVGGAPEQESGAAGQDDTVEDAEIDDLLCEGCTA